MHPHQLIEERLNREIIATNVSGADYLEHYAADFCEWVDGTVVKMSPVYAVHDLLTRYFAMLFEAYFPYHLIGQIRQASFVMRLERSREPDLQVILKDNPYSLRETYMDGPADICIEITSPGSEDIDYGPKFVEYEKGGVKAYWLIAPKRQDCRLHRLDTRILWQRPLANIGQIIEMVKQMVQVTFMYRNSTCGD